MAKPFFFVQLDDRWRSAIEAACRKFAGSGQRVLGFADLSLPQDGLGGDMDKLDPQVSGTIEDGIMLLFGPNNLQAIDSKVEKVLN